MHYELHYFNQKNLIRIAQWKIIKICTIPHLSQHKRRPSSSMFTKKPSPPRIPSNSKSAKSARSWWPRMRWAPLSPPPPPPAIHPRPRRQTLLEQQRTPTPSRKQPAILHLGTTTVRGPSSSWHRGLWGQRLKEVLLVSRVDRRPLLDELISKRL